VYFDQATGTGFVGKGDVQTAFGWNNATLQKNGRDVWFSMESSDTYSATCTWITGEGTRGEKTHDVTIPRHTTLNSAIEYDARTHKQIDGYFLTGFGASTTTGTAPVVGDACVGGEDGIAHNGTWTSVELTGSTTGVLTVYWTTLSAVLPYTTL
jgi:hypothetical protein